MIQRGAVMCPACLRGTITAGPDEVRIPSPYQTNELLSPDSTSGCLGGGPICFIIIHSALAFLTAGLSAVCFFGSVGLIDFSLYHKGPCGARRLICDGDGYEARRFTLQ